MILRMLQLGRFAALLLVGLGFSAAPASAGCGYSGCYAAAPVIVQPQPYTYQSCSCCGCGSAYYTSYYPAYTYPSAYYGYEGGYGCGGCGYGYGYGAGYAYAGVDVGAVGPGYYRHRAYGPRYVGARRFVR
jgi:hypothetical protein